MLQETNKEKIKEFFDLTGDEHYELRKFSRPVLVYKIDDGIVYYSLWESTLLQRFGIKNVDGWDYEIDTIFCPDWITGEDDFDDEFDDEFDDDQDWQKKSYSYSRNLKLFYLQTIKNGTL